jgi:hypothetical protein
MVLAGNVSGEEGDECIPSRSKHLFHAMVNFYTSLCVLRRLLLKQ